jgi:hypothetical protein
LYFAFTAVIKPAVEEGKKVYDAEGLDVDLYSRWMYNVNDNFSCVHMCTDLLQLTIQTTHVLSLKIKNLKMTPHRSHLFQQKIRCVFDLIICQLIYLDHTA